jgi:peptidoglycan hydrolase-like protein with peptidoglycan-binding domain
VGETVEAVQDALVDAGVDVPGGADGVYGNDTMAAVAAYQRRDGDLQVTGAVDMATARALGVYADPEAAAETTTAQARTVAATTVAPVRAAPVEVPAHPLDTDNGFRWWPIIVAAAVIALAAGVAGRRRYVVARRAARRWARVHPSTSPRRSVADGRRAGDPEPTTPVPTGRIYDHESEAAGTPAEADSVSQLSGAPPTQQ